MDFSNAKLPELRPLAQSFVVDEREDELRRLFMALFTAHLGEKSFDANVLGAAHLGSLPLVQKSLTAEGLAMMPGGVSGNQQRSESAARYLYRAWKGNNGQGRGLHFLRTYLQLLYPNACKVQQLWHLPFIEYPNGILNPDVSNYAGFFPKIGPSQGLKLDGSWNVGKGIGPSDEEKLHPERYFARIGAYLTSRVRISLDFDVQAASISQLIGVFQATMPARLLPEIRFSLRAAFDCAPSLRTATTIRKVGVTRYPWRALTVTTNPETKWKLGRDGSTGGPALRERIVARLTIRKSGVATRPWRLNGVALDGSWGVGGVGDTRLSPTEIGMTIRVV